MSAASDYLETQISNHLLRTASWTKPSAIYVALFTAAPSDSGGGTEVSGGSYARVQHGPSDATWAVSNGVCTNTGVIQFASPTADWGTITHFGLFDASTAGNLLVWGALNTGLSIYNGNPAPFFNEGLLIITIA
jgi:hypothetical protein